MAQCFNIVDQRLGDVFSLPVIADKDIRPWLPFLCASSQIFPRKFRLSEGIGPTHYFSYGQTGIKTPNQAIHGVCETPHTIGVVSAEPIRSVHGQVFSNCWEKWQRKSVSAAGRTPDVGLTHFLVPKPWLGNAFVYETLFHHGSQARRPSRRSLTGGI